MICFYCISTQLGGAERSLLEFLQGLIQKSDFRYRPWVIVPKAQGPLVDALRASGIQVSVLPMPAGMLKLSRETPLKSLFLSVMTIWLLPFYFVRLLKLLKTHHPKLIHTTGIKCHWIGALAGKLLGIPVLWHLRDIFTPGPTRLLLQWTARFTSLHMISNSQATQGSFQKSPLLGKVIYNGLQLERYQSQKDQSIRAEYKIPLDAPLIGIVGALARWKGQREFILAASDVLKLHPEAHFLIVGGGIYDTLGDQGYEQELIRLVSELNMNERVHFTGFRKDSVVVYNNLDILVHASTRPEPFGRVVLEAMACSTATVATRGGGINEFVIDQVTGLLVAPENVSQMTAAISRLISDLPLQEKIVAAALEKLRNQFTMDRHVKEIQQTYLEILSPHEA